MDKWSHIFFECPLNFLQLMFCLYCLFFGAYLSFLIEEYSLSHMCDWLLQWQVCKRYLAFYWFFESSKQFSAARSSGALFSIGSHQFKAKSTSWRTQTGSHAGSRFDWNHFFIRVFRYLCFSIYLAVYIPPCNNRQEAFVWFTVRI